MRNVSTWPQFHGHTDITEVGPSMVLDGRGVAYEDGACSRTNAPMVIIILIKQDNTFF